MSFSPVTPVNSSYIDIIAEKERSVLLKIREANQSLESPSHPCTDLLNSQALDLSIEDFDSMIIELEINRGESLQQLLNYLEETLKETGHVSSIRSTEEYRVIREEIEVTGNELYPLKFIVAASSLVHMKRVDGDVYPCSTRFDFYELYEGSVAVLDSLTRLRQLIQEDDFSAFMAALIQFDGCLSEVIERSYPLFNPTKVNEHLAGGMGVEETKENKG
ncbi:MAG: hypothetical protein ACI9S8_001712 [Chlamydiales bacterium]|jgi:hypothetical protein